MAFGNSMCGTRLLKKPPTPNFCMPVPTTAQNVMPASAAVTVSAPVAEPAQGKNPQQVAKQNEEEHVPQKRQELVGVVLADRRPGNLVANEHQHHLEEVPKQSLGRAAATNPPGQANKHQ